MFTHFVAWRNLPIHLKMATQIAAFTVVAMASIAAYTEISTRDEIITATHAQNLQRAHGTAEVLDTFLANILANVRFFGTATSAIEYLRDPQAPAQRDQIERSIAEIRAIYQYDAFYLTDQSGTVLASTNARLLGRNYNTAPYFRSATAGQVAFDEPRYDANDQQVYLHFSAPVRDPQGIIWGAAIGRVQMTALDRIIAADNNFSGRGDFSVLWDDLGIRLGHSIRPDLRFKPFAPLNPDVANSIIYEQRFGPTTAQILADASQTPELVQRGKLLLHDSNTDPYLNYISETAGPVFAALVPLKNQRWVYGVLTPQAGILSAISTQTERAVAATLLVSLLAIVGAFLAARWITQPIRKVAETANALASGDMSRRVRLKQHDEVGNLANAFDTMADALAEKETQLRSYAQTLEQRVDERTAEVSTSEEKYHALMNDASDAILIADLRGNLMDVNRKAEELLGYPKVQLVGMRVEQIHPSEELPRTLALFKQIIKTGSGILRDGLVLRQDGKTVPVEITSNIIEYSDGQFVQGIFHDITVQKQRERELQAIVTLATALRGATTRAEMLPVILDQVMYLLNAAGATLAKIEPTTGDFLVELGRGCWVASTGTRVPAGKGVTGQVIATSKPYVGDDAASDPLIHRPVWVGGVSAFACVPLISQHETIGALWVGRDTAIGDDELRILIALADIAANALHRATLFEQTAHMYDEAQQNVRRLTALRAVDQAITASLDLRLILRVLLDQVVTFLQADAADVWLFNPVTQSLKYAEGHGFTTREMERLTCRLGEGYAGQIAFERHVVHIPDLKRTPEQSPRTAALAPEGFVAYLGAPLIAKGQLKGVLEIFHRRPLAAAEEWMDFIESLALQTAIAIDNVTLFNDLQRSNLELSLAADAMIESWAHALGLRGRETAGHIRQVAQDTVRLARALGIGEADLVHVRRGALLHDIGKLGIPDSILFKPGALTETEQAVIRQHPVYARELLAQIEFLKPALGIPDCHHEKWNGSGYPRGLRGEAIPLAARAFAVVDCWSTLRADRAYAPAWDKAHTLDYLREQAGKKFDPKIVRVFLNIIENES